MKNVEAACASSLNLHVSKAAVSRGALPWQECLPFWDACPMRCRVSPLHGTQCKASTLPKTACPMKMQTQFSSWDMTGGAGRAHEARTSSQGAIPVRVHWEAGVEVPRRQHDVPTMDSDNAPVHKSDPPSACLEVACAAPAPACMSECQTFGSHPLSPSVCCNGGIGGVMGSNTTYHSQQFFHLRQSHPVMCVPERSKGCFPTTDMCHLQGNTD